MSTESPLACDLTAIPADERERHQSVAERLFAAVQAASELPDGYELQLAADMYPTVAEFVSRERLCCPFFRFVLELEPDGGPLSLRLTGREDVKQLLQTEFSGLLGQMGTAN